MNKTDVRVNKFQEEYEKYLKEYSDKEFKDSLFYRLFDRLKNINTIDSKLPNYLIEDLNKKKMPIQCFAKLWFLFYNFSESAGNLEKYFNKYTKEEIINNWEAFLYFIPTINGGDKNGQKNGHQCALLISQVLYRLSGEDVSLSFIEKMIRNINHFSDVLNDNPYDTQDEVYQFKKLLSQRDNLTYRFVKRYNKYISKPHLARNVEFKKKCSEVVYDDCYYDVEETLVEEYFNLFKGHEDYVVKNMIDNISDKEIMNNLPFLIRGICKSL